MEILGIEVNYCIFVYFSQRFRLESKGYGQYKKPTSFEGGTVLSGDTAMMRIVRSESVLHEFVDLGFGTFLVHIPGTDKRSIISSVQREVLLRCVGRDTFASHLARICNSMKLANGERAGVAAILDDLVQKGLLIKENELNSLPPSLSKKNRRIGTVAFLTADRPSVFRRSFMSYQNHCQRLNREVTLLVMDDSESLAARSEYLELLKPAGKTDSVEYGGRSEKLRFLDHLAGQGIDPAIASFAICGLPGRYACSIGANRNCVLLDTLGELVLMADDDTVCTMVTHPERNDSLRFGNHENPREVWFYTSREEIAKAAREGTGDLLSEHEYFLGGSLPELLAQLSPDLVESDQACQHLLAASAQNQARVVATMSGLAGDSGAAYAQRFLSSAKYLARLNESEATSRRAFASREVLWVARSRTITHSTHCQGAGLGVANNEFLPPFFPAGRNEDGVFGLLNFLAPSHFFAHLPIAVFHDAMVDRKYPELPSLRITDLVTSLIQFVPRHQHAKLQTTLCSIGAGLQEIGGLTEHELRAVLFAAVSQSVARTSRQLDLNNRTIGHSNPFLQVEIERFRKHLRDSLLASDAIIPTEYQRMPAELALAETRELVKKAGQLFCAWYDLVEACRYLKAKGIRLSRPIADVSE